MSNESQDPFQSQPTSDAANNSSASNGAKPWLWIIGGIALLGVLSLGCCGGVGYWLYGLASGTLAENFSTQLRDNPVLAEQIGKDFTLELNLTKTGEHQQDKPNAIAFDIEGSNGSGLIVIIQDLTGSAPEVDSAELILDDGQRFDVSADQMVIGSEEIDLDDLEAGLEDLNLDF